MPTLRENPTITDLQSYVIELETERGFSNQPLIQKCLLLGEEVGELYKAVRKSEGMRLDPASSVGAIEDELADVLIYLCAISNLKGINLESAFRKKEEKNKNRMWISANASSHSVNS